jgi:cephalosporin hydroxylase
MTNKDLPRSLQDYLFLGRRFAWHMGWTDRLGLLHVLRQLRPDAVLEIGTYEGGSLEVMAQYSRRTYSIDIDPGVATKLRPHFPSVEFMSGDSSKMIGEALSVPPPISWTPG